MRLGQGRENAKEFLRQNIELCDEIEAVVRERALAGEYTPELTGAASEDADDEA